MRLLFDQNLSRHLLSQLGVEYPESLHIIDVGLDTATDVEIWAWAGQHDYVIVSKDSDFRQLAFLHGPPPKAVWLRLGNASTLDVFNVLRDHLDDVTRFAATEDEALLVLPAP